MGLTVFGTGAVVVARTLPVLCSPRRSRVASASAHDVHSTLPWHGQVQVRRFTRLFACFWIPTLSSSPSTHSLWSTSIVLYPPSRRPLSLALGSSCLTCFLPSFWVGAFAVSLRRILHVLISTASLFLALSSPTSTMYSLSAVLACRRTVSYAKATPTTRYLHPSSILHSSIHYKYQSLMAPLCRFRHGRYRVGELCIKFHHHILLT
ncbi:hypothetical protein BDZ97DRAFT_1800709 [Flammula alnicola]|nr:hypothetical protein BDZ97DRAFT_1800709 [Flammula alnicola]